MPRIKIRSNASIFEDRGDPWVTKKDAQKDYPEQRGFTGNPELDQFRCHKALRKLVMASEPRHSPEADRDKRVANILNRMHMAFARAERLRREEI